MRYMKRRFIPRTPGWIAKIDSSHGSIQRWSKERDYYGKSAEEAVYSLLKSNNLYSFNLIPIHMKAVLLVFENIFVLILLTLRRIKENGFYL